MEVFSEEGKDKVVLQIITTGLSAILLHMGEYQDAADACMKYAESCSRAGQMHSLSKAYLSAIIALLYDGDGLNAQAAFNDIHEVRIRQERGTRGGVQVAQRVSRIEHR